MVGKVFRLKFAYIEGDCTKALFFDGLWHIAYFLCCYFSDLSMTILELVDFLSTVAPLKQFS
jgi:hypothetical protein